MTSLTASALNQILIMLFLIIIGAISFKVKLIDKDMNKRLSDLVLMLINPFMIFIAYQRKFEATLLKGLLISLVMAFATHIFGIIISNLFLRKKNHEKDFTIERFAVIYSNCGFIGIPLVNGILGSEGVFYITAYMTIFNLFVWTHGVILMTGKRDKSTITKAFLSPSVIATILGFLFFTVRIAIPGILLDSLNYVGNMNTPMAMLVAGVTIAQTNIPKVVGKLRIYYITFFKLLFIPLVMLLIFCLFDIPRVVLLTSVLAAACPAAATINLFSIRYDKNYLYASELFAVSTILTIITVPLVMTIAEALV